MLGSVDPLVLVAILASLSLLFLKRERSLSQCDQVDAFNTIRYVLHENHLKISLIAGKSLLLNEGIAHLL